MTPEARNKKAIYTINALVDIAFWGTPSPSSAIYNFGHSVRGRAIGTKIRLKLRSNCVCNTQRM